MRPARIVRREAAAQGCGSEPWPDDVHAVLRGVYAMRGVHRYADTKPKLADLLAPSTLGGIEAASTLLADAICADRRIVVVGDFDCDGATGVAVGVRGLRLLGARHVAYQVPHRILHGYGLTPALVEVMEPLRPDLVVTVDNGIACHAGIAAAKARGCNVLVTDHHLPGASLPPADAIVNPNLVAFTLCTHGHTHCDTCASAARMNEAFASKAMAGVGVLFYLLLATRRRLREQGWFEAASGRVGEPDLSVLLDLVAVGTVADMVSLDANNRTLVAAGLRRLRAGACQPGLRALAEVAGRKLDRLTTSDIGFFIAPRINAAGRLEDMAIGIECLLCDDAARAAELAHTLDAINRERRSVQEDMVAEAEHLASLAGEDARAAICVHDASWHPGVVGLVASKLKERLHRPAIAFAPSEPGSVVWRGSARSIPGFHIRDALAEVDAAQPGLIGRFGGHAMAAGLTINDRDVPMFAQAFDAVARARIAPELLDAMVLSDGELDPAEATLDLAQQLQSGGPWGQGFPEPVFDGVFDIASWRVVGERHLKLQLVAAGRCFDAIEFGGWRNEPPPTAVRIAYRLDINEWRGAQSVQLLVVHREHG